MLTIFFQDECVSRLLFDIFRGKFRYSTASFLLSRLNSQNAYFLFHFLPEIAFCSWRPGNTEMCVFLLLPTQHARSLLAWNVDQNCLQTWLIGWVG
jgi:hypothetical protein